MAKHIIMTVGFDLSSEAQNLDFTSERSLLDADIVVFRPGFVIDFSRDSLQGKPVVSETYSFQLVEAAKHWSTELGTAFDAGKTIIVFLAKPQEVFVRTGEKEFSGTGRNRSVTNLARPFSSYEALPIPFQRITPKSGKEIKAVKNLKFLAPYWQEFGQYSSYEVYVDHSFTEVFLTTKTANKVVGATLQNNKGGTIIFLPPLHGTTKIKSFKNRFATCLVELDNVLRSSRESTPAPTWTQDVEYKLPQESAIEGQILSLDMEMQELAKRKNALLIDHANEGSLRRLLYETGHELERAILDSLPRLCPLSGQNKRGKIR